VHVVGPVSEHKATKITKNSAGKRIAISSTSSTTTVAAKVNDVEYLQALNRRPSRSRTFGNSVGYPLARPRSRREMHNHAFPSLRRRVDWRMRTTT
jgi:hypothetical protein